jgi:hypothetical protein
MNSFLDEMSRPITLQGALTLLSLVLSVLALAISLST